LGKDRLRKGLRHEINHLKSLQRAGAGYLLIPCPSSWWLQHYASFAEYLAGAAEEAFREADLCAIFSLSPLLQDD
jgi:hypothetical protein